MNVMKEAHKQANELLASRPNIAYRTALILGLIHAHKVNKQMKAEEKAAHKAWAIKHFEDCIEATLVHFEALNVNDFYIAILNNERTNDYTLLQHKIKGDTSSPLGWAGYADAIKTHSRQADMYLLSYEGTVKLHAQTHLSKTLDYLRNELEQIKAK